MTSDLEGLPLFTQKTTLPRNVHLVWMVMAPTDGSVFGAYWTQEALVAEVRSRFGVPMNTHALNARFADLRKAGWQVDKRLTQAGSRTYEYRLSRRVAA